ncbi:hypothetical protein Pla123a_02530 [Posidoniimonas polymericola]|uniref:DUF3137 domain-containing protein n=1 Tax=Posidoniimonas polymericola TaxID=2528002 RepID=A0A5C5ZE69_9BACT|nr:hypothetical protein [Posidoniimonas polymericola]TWT85446.1 hypothetical protein Pla123a_02530 [Posidoniimonas polymericola]
MESVLPIIVIAAVVALIIVAAVASHRAAKARRDALAALAAARGWTFSPDRDRNHDDHFRQFRQFRQGNGRYAYNSVFGAMKLNDRELPIKLGDFHYETHSTNSKGQSTTHHHHFSYLLSELPSAATPDVTIRPEGVFDKVGAFFGFDDIDFESSEFSNKFHVSSDDKRFAYAIVHPRMMEFLLATRGPTLILSQGHALVTQGGTWKPEEFAPSVEWLEMFFDRWPDHVLADLKSRA